MISCECGIFSTTIINCTAVVCEVFSEITVDANTIIDCTCLPHCGVSDESTVYSISNIIKYLIDGSSHICMVFNKSTVHNRVMPNISSYINRTTIIGCGICDENAVFIISGSPRTSTIPCGVFIKAAVHTVIYGDCTSIIRRVIDKSTVYRCTLTINSPSINI